MRLVHSDKPIYLFSGYLLESAKTKQSKKEPLVFSLDIGIEVPVYEVDRRFWLDDHVEGGFLYRGAVTLRVDRSTSPPTVTYDLEALSTARLVNEEVKPLETSKEGELLFELPLGFEEGTANPPRPGFRGRLLLKASAWNTA